MILLPHEIEFHCRQAPQIETAIGIEVQIPHVALHLSKRQRRSSARVFVGRQFGNLLETVGALNLFNTSPGLIWNQQFDIRQSQPHIKIIRERR
jgi:hypothetical protein